jgi:hypothetical protein
MTGCSLHESDPSSRTGSTRGSRGRVPVMRLPFTAVATLRDWPVTANGTLCLQLRNPFSETCRCWRAAERSGQELMPAGVGRLHQGKETQQSRELFVFIGSFA